MGSEIELVLPDLRYPDSVIAAVREFGTTTKHGSGLWDLTVEDATVETLAERIPGLLAQSDPATELPEGRVHSDYWWMVDGDEFVGFLAIRHDLTEFLLDEGGHIGYGVRPSRRREGHATRALELALVRAREIGLDRVLLTCDETNTASRRDDRAQRRCPRGHPQGKASLLDLPDLSGEGWSTFRPVSAQAPSAVILDPRRPVHPQPGDRGRQRVPGRRPGGAVATRRPRPSALAEMDALAEALRAAGVRVHVFDDEDHTRPDSVFPNNWLSTHAGGNVAVYPMYASNRRHERRADVLEMLKSEYRVQTIVDYSGLEPDGIFLEGTGAMVLDHVSRVAYTARSHRADTHVLERFCTDFGYEPMAFDAVDSDGVPVYHTNVIACIGTDVAHDRPRDDPRRAASRAGPRAARRSTAARSSS